MKRYRVEPGTKVSLRDYDPGDTSAAGKGGKEKAPELVRKLGERLDELQDLLYASREKKLLIVLQGMDTSGKDGTIRSVFQSVDPLGVRVAAFKAPTAEELDHDFLWRIHRQVPGKGEIAIFNRSHYEDVLVVRVRGLAPKKVWQQRYDQINEFERMLHESGTIIVKFFLHIGEDEQKERLQDRIDDPTKRWKFNAGDLEERRLWKDYMEAYEDVLSRTSKEWAPWYVVPSNRKWVRNLVVSQVLVDALERMKLRYPEPEGDFQNLRVE
jgi:PPK2 family polyphosphate:nucleotide phosphotransferase